MIFEQIWVARLRHKNLDTRKVVSYLKELITECELADHVEGPVVKRTRHGDIIKLKCSRKVIRILVKCPGIIKWSTSPDEKTLED